MPIEKIILTDRPETKKGYILPFRGSQIKIIQGYNGPYSHLATRRSVDDSSLTIIEDDRFSVDFLLPEGTSVITPRAGRIAVSMDEIDSYYQGLDLQIGLRSVPNFVLLSHDDETYSLLSHLAKNSITVPKEEWVKQGQELAKTGKSGWVGPSPHLHFAAFRFAGQRRERRTFPVSFFDYIGSLEHEDICKPIA